MAILNQILSQQPFSVRPPMVLPEGMRGQGFVHPMAPPSAGMNPQDPGRVEAENDPRRFQFGGGMEPPASQDGRGGGMFANVGSFGDLVSSLMHHRGGDVSGTPPVGGGTAPVRRVPTANPYGSGIMGSVMKAFNGGASGGFDPAKLMAMIGMGG